MSSEVAAPARALAESMNAVAGPIPKGVVIDDTPSDVEDDAHSPREDPEDMLMTKQSSRKKSTPATAATKPKSKPESKKRARQGTAAKPRPVRPLEDLIPRATAAWSIKLMFPAMFSALVTLVKKQYEELTLYPTRTDRFSGIAVDTMNKSKTSMTISRLHYDTTIYPRPGPDGAMFTPQEDSIRVRTDVLLSALKELKSHTNPVFYRERDSDYAVLAAHDNLGMTVKLEVPLITDNTRHTSMQNHDYSIQLVAPLSVVKGAVNSAKNRKAEDLQISLRELDATTNLITFDASGDNGKMFCGYPIIKKLPKIGGSGGDGDDGKQEDEAASDHTISNANIRITSQTKAMLVHQYTQDMGSTVLPVTRGEIEALPLKHSQVHSVNALHSMLSTMRDEGCMTLYLGRDKPLIMYCELDTKASKSGAGQTDEEGEGGGPVQKSASFISFMLAAKLDPDEEEEDDDGGDSGGARRGPAGAEYDADA